MMNNLNRLTLSEALAGLKDGKFSSVELVRACLERIKKTDQEVKAFLVLFEKEALEEAKAADREIKKNKNAFVKKPLLGIPFALKDNYLVKGKITTAASKVLDNYEAHYSATVTEKLLSAGAIILGKTNLDAWSHGSSTETSDYQTTKNPHDLGKLPGGSSGGSAAAVAADQVIFAIGTETAGSIRLPSAWCGVVGLKPTYGRVSRYGVVAMGSSLDSPGPITKTVEDAALILEIIAGADKFDATATNLEVENYFTNLKDSVKGKTVGLPKEYFMEKTQKGINEMVLRTVKKLQSLGAKVKQVSILDPKYSIADYTIIQRAEVSSNLARYDGVRYGNGRDFFGEEAKKRVMLGTYVLSAGYYDAYYKKAQKVRMLMKKDFDRVFAEVDVIISPTTASTALPVGSSKSHPMFGEIMDVLLESSALVGLCGITVPVGSLKGLPVGMQFMGNHFQEQIILNFAHTYEKNFGSKLEPSL